MRRTLIILCCLLAPFALSDTTMEEPSWRKGRLYFSNVCTQCHKKTIGKPISPNSRTAAEWDKYLLTDIHAPGKDNRSISWFLSKKYREQIKSKNAVAAAFINMSEDELWGHVDAYLIHGAKDSNTPLSCF